MPEREGELAFSNPLPPEAMEDDGDHDHEPALTNEDFRRLLMTPRDAPNSAPPSSSSSSAAVRQDRDLGDQYNEDMDPNERRRRKKRYYANLKKQEEDKLAELAKKYRDRAKERRDGTNKDYEETEMVSTTTNYRAVAPNAQPVDTAERRRQLIQESKFLGGDMEHTHLVKGLDYALLQKVRSEIHTKEREEDDLDTIVLEKKQEEEEEEMEFKTRMARSVYRTLFKIKPPERNELFLPGRMAYVIDLEDEYTDTDVPTTLIRSKADCPSLESQTTLTTNDIVINKLTQILSYLRQGVRGKKLKKKDKGRGREEKPHRLPGGDDIFGDVGDYIPQVHKSKDRHSHSHSHEKKRSSYFEKPRTEDEPSLMDVKPPSSAKEMVKNINEKFRDKADKMDWSESMVHAEQEHQKRERKKKMDMAFQPDSYAECYPGMGEILGGDDSDDEVDYTKMDQGNKKGPIGRWDFDTQEEYSEYMSNKEALPKAAFQYGIKMADGRKTRRAGPKDEMKELDREWKKIQNIIEKRKTKSGGGASSSASRTDEPDYKRPRY
ncbi:IK [Branchiostoma lanceolatum]|uniref:IK protein n=1 Tax=Branchiostoma lanceolatum TaxID=7740 RepID=A0A8K0A5A0_BRALA|nr:IK [Branchiostoma lanceolatum]